MVLNSKKGELILQKEIVELIKNEIICLNSLKGIKADLHLNLDSPLYGSSSQLDSLDLINLIVGLEKQVQNTFNKTIFLADDRALSLEVSPFSSIEALSLYVTELIKSADE